MQTTVDMDSGIMDTNIVLYLLVASAAVVTSTALGVPVEAPNSRVAAGTKAICTKYLIQLPTSNYVYRPILPYDLLHTSEPVLRMEHRGSSIGLPDVFDKPVVLLVKAEGGENDLVAYLFEGGLLDIPDNPSTLFIQEALESGDDDKLALLFRPATFPNLQQLRLGRLPLMKFVVPPGIKVAQLARLVEEDLPWLLILNKNEIEKFNVDELRHIGDVDVSETTLDVIKVMTKGGIKYSDIKTFDKV